jgi:hypothetical protein
MARRKHICKNKIPIPVRLLLAHTIASDYSPFKFQFTATQEAHALPDVATLEEFLGINSIAVYWTSLDGRRIEIKDLTNGHLYNLIKFLKRKGYTLAHDICECEAFRRVAEYLPERFNDLCAEYSRNPETWRMEIIYVMNNQN